MDLMDNSKRLQDELKKVVYDLAEQGTTVEDIRVDPKVSALLHALRPVEVCEQYAHHQFLMAMIQRARNPDGTRKFVSVHQPRLFPLGPGYAGHYTIFYAGLAAVLASPHFQRIALVKLHSMIAGLIKSAGYIHEDYRTELVRMIGDVFSDLQGRIAG